MSELYIVTGALGHLGSTIIQSLCAKGSCVRGFDLPHPTTKDRDTGCARMYYGNICDPASLDALFADTDGSDVIVIHTAGIVSIASKINPQLKNVNVEGTRNIVEKCLQYHVKRLVYVSSVHAIPEAADGGLITEAGHFDPDLVHGPYAKTKAMATQIVLDGVKRGLDAVVVHPSGIIGPNDTGRSHTDRLISDYLNGKLTACVRGGYDFVDVRDAAEGTIAAAEKGKTGECYILSNRYYEISEILDAIHEVSGKKKIRTILPMWFAKLTAPLAELYYRIRKSPPLFTRYSLYTLTSNSNFSHKKAETDLGYKPRSIRQTLTDTVEFLKKTGQVHLAAARRKPAFSKNS